MWFWIFTHTKLKHKSKIKTETMHIKKCKMHKMHEGSYEGRKNQIKDQKSKSTTIGTLPHTNGTIVWNECLKRSETRVERMRTGDAYRQGVKSTKHFL